ncbi:FHY3/FAR1 family protein [Dioscorea alata]|uniref:FHY3/FAR1 family protein n=1 Tax=Dioscorea alata TaxID=55571 RepID=A0ACB7UKU6_DIOAL|nr:FHY3/FAR1 family protein [Dioscorea alata]
MVFNSEEEVYDFYVKYAQQEGFGITKRTIKSGDDGKLKYYTLACVRGGKRTSTAKDSFKPRLFTKTNCQTRVNVIVDNDGHFMISRIHFEHNHTLSPQKSRFQKCNKKMDTYIKRRLELNNQAEKDCRNYIARARQFRLGVGDAEAIGNYFSRMQRRNPNFFHLIDMNEKGQLKNVFWADARSITAYEVFGDVISFDTTYLTNKYDMPFAPFVGVNHHGQTILFGCGAVRSVFPNSHHRLCLWHIMKKIPEKLGGLLHYKAVKKILKSIVYESMNIQEFEDNWLKMIGDYNLEKNRWLNSLYICRIQYDNALKSKIEKENKADFSSFNSNFSTLTDCNFEKQLQQAYTNEIFKLFQDELRGMIYCNLTFINSDGPICTFQVTDIFRGKEGVLRKQVVFNVQHNDLEFDIKCSCHLFEFRGIICRHICKILIEKNVKEIPSHYILTRWRKDVKHRHTYVKNCYDETQTIEQKVRYNKLCVHFSKDAEIGVESNEKYNFLMKCVDNAMEKLMDNTHETGTFNVVLINTYTFSFLQTPQQQQQQQ